MDYVQSNKKDSGNDISLEKDLAEISVLEKKLQNAEDTIQELQKALSVTKSTGSQMVIALKDRDAEIMELKIQLEVSRNETDKANRLLESKVMLEDKSKLLKERDHTLEELTKEGSVLQAKENAIKELEKKNKDLDKELQHEQEITRHLIQTNLTVTTLHLLPYRHWDRLTGTKMLVSTIYVLILANQK